MSWLLINLLILRIPRLSTSRTEQNPGQRLLCQVLHLNFYLINQDLIKLIAVNTGNSNRNGVSAGGPVSSGGPQVEAEGGSSVYCPRHHHHTQQGGQTRQTPSPNKRHRLTPRPHNIQRPCLDFEKMQQVKNQYTVMKQSFAKSLV